MTTSRPGGSDDRGNAYTGPEAGPSTWSQRERSDNHPTSSDDEQTRFIDSHGRVRIVTPPSLDIPRSPWLSDYDADTESQHAFDMIYPATSLGPGTFGRKVDAGVPGRQPTRYNVSSLSAAQARRSPQRWSGSFAGPSQGGTTDLIASSDAVSGMAEQTGYSTSLSPRLQSNQHFEAEGVEGTRQRHSRSPQLQHDAEQIRTPSEHADQVRRTLSPPRTTSVSPTGRGGAGYRGYERELEAKQAQQSKRKPVTRAATVDEASPLIGLALTSSELSLAGLQAIPRKRSGSTPVLSPSVPHSTSGHDGLERRAKHVSLGNVSIEGVPFALHSAAPWSASPNAADQDAVRPSGALRQHPNRRARSSTERTVAVDLADAPWAATQATEAERHHLKPTVSQQDAPPSGVRRDRSSKNNTARRGGARWAARLFGRFPTRDSTFDREETVAAPRSNDPDSTGRRRSDLAYEPSSHPFPVRNHGDGASKRASNNSGNRTSSSTMQWDSSQAAAVAFQLADGTEATHKRSLQRASHEAWTDGQNRHGRRPSTVSHAQRRSDAQYHLHALNALRCRLPDQPSSSLDAIRYTGLLPRLHHACLFLLTYLPILITLALDYNALYTLVQIALYPLAGQSAAAWWIAVGLYAASLLFWLVGVVIVWEYVVQYRRRWINPRPYALPLYLSSAGFTLTTRRSYDLYCLFYRTRLAACPFDFWIESCWFASQNGPTMLTLLPRGIILTVLLVMNRTVGQGEVGNGVMTRDPVYFQGDGTLTTFAFGFLLANVAWSAWRLLVLSVAYVGLLISLGPRALIKREQAMYVEQTASTISYPSLNEDTAAEAHAATEHGAAVQQVENGARSPAWAWRSRAEERLNRYSYLLEMNDYDDNRLSSSYVDVAEEIDRADGEGQMTTRPTPSSIDRPKNSTQAEMTQIHGLALDPLEESQWLRASRDHFDPSQQIHTSNASTTYVQIHPSITIDPAATSSASALPTRATSLRSPVHEVDLRITAVPIDTVPSAAHQGLSPSPPRRTTLLTAAPSAVHDATMLEAMRPAGFSRAPTAQTLYSQEASATSSFDSVLTALPTGRTFEGDTSQTTKRWSNSSSSGTVVRTRDTTAPSSTSSPQQPDSIYAESAHPKVLLTPASLTVARTTVHGSASPLSGMRTSDARSTPAERQEGTGNDKEALDEAIARLEEGNQSSSDTASDDSEERRIWSAFPEQSRRRPPGLVALEWEQRLSQERLQRFSSSTSTRSDRERRNEEEPGQLDEVDLPTTDTNASYSSATQLLSGSLPSDVLGPIQEESWSQSQGVTTDGTDEEEDYAGPHPSRQYYHPVTQG